MATKQIQNKPKVQKNLNETLTNRVGKITTIIKKNFEEARDLKY